LLYLFLKPILYCSSSATIATAHWSSESKISYQLL